MENRKPIWEQLGETLPPDETPIKKEKLYDERKEKRSSSSARDYESVRIYRETLEDLDIICAYQCIDTRKMPAKIEKLREIVKEYLERCESKRKGQPHG